VTDVVEITGLEVLRQRFAALAAAKDLGPTLRAEAEAEAVAAEARATLAASSAGAALARSIEVVEIGQGDRLGYAVGTAAPAGHFLEFGTSRMRASPWLGPVLNARLPTIMQAIRNVLAMVGGARGGGV
jgi:hypothetical protein